MKVSDDFFSFIYLFSYSTFRWTKKISFCGLSLFKNVNIVGNPGSCGNDLMSWRELEITQQSQCAIPSRRLNILLALPVYPLLSDITGPLLKSWRPTLKSRSTVATHIFHGRYVEWWMDPFMLLNYDFGSRELLECLWEVKIQLFIAPFACRGKHFRRTAVADRSGFVLEWILWGYRTLERAGFVFTAGSNYFLFVWATKKLECQWQSFLHLLKSAAPPTWVALCHIDYRNPSVLTQWTCLLEKGQVRGGGVRGGSWGICVERDGIHVRIEQSAAGETSPN